MTDAFPWDETPRHMAQQIHRDGTAAESVDYQNIELLRKVIRDLLLHLERRVARNDIDLRA